MELHVSASLLSQSLSTCFPVVVSQLHNGVTIISYLFSVCSHVFEGVQDEAGVTVMLN